jgi:signal transduction histidine kinase
MTLRQKTLLIIGVTLLCLLLTLHFSLSKIWLNGFANIELQRTHLDVERVTAALSNDLEELNSTAKDWAGWDETYTFVEDINQGYIQNNLSEATFVNLRLNIMLYANQNGEIIYSKGFDLDQKVEVSVPQSLKQYLLTYPQILQHSTSQSHYQGIVALPEGSLLVSSQPILNNNRTAPIRGTLFIGRFLDTSEVRRLSKLTRLSLRVYPLQAAQLPKEIQTVKDRFLNEEQIHILIQFLNPKQIAGYTLLRDIVEQPGILLRVDIPRDIYQQGKEGLRYVGAALFAVGLAFAIVALLLLEKLVLSPIAQLSAAVRRIRTEGDLSERLFTKGRNELSRLGMAINQLLATLQQSQLRLSQSEVRERMKAQALEQTIRELTQAQSQLVHSEKLSSLGQLVAGVAHEINNPISFVYGNINHADEYIQDLLHLINCYQQQYPNPSEKITAEMEEIDFNFLVDDLPKLLNSMKIGTERICEIVQSLRNFSRVNETELKAVDIHEGLESTLLILRHQLKAKGEYASIELMKEYGDLPLVECYPGQLNQVLMNLLVNAIDALEERRIHKTHNPSEDAPLIRIRTEVKDNDSLFSSEESIESIVIRITDNGTGMSEDVCQQLFDPFFTTKPAGKGTGLGLSISYQIVVDKHKGQLLVKSEIGQGSEFIIELPVHQFSNS